MSGLFFLLGCRVFLPSLVRRICALSIFAVMATGFSLNTSNAQSNNDLLSELLASNSGPTSFPRFSETPERAKAFNAIKNAMGLRKSNITAADLTNGLIADARKTLQSNVQYTDDAEAVLAEMESWVSMKQDIINYFGEINILFNGMNSDQLATIDTVYDRLTLQYPPSFEVKEELGQIYLDMLLGGLGAGGSFLGGSNVDSVAFAGGAIGGVLGIINLAITAANDIERLENEQQFALRNKGKEPLQLHKARLKDAITDRFGAMRKRNFEIRDRVLGDYYLLQVFSRQRQLTATDRDHIVGEYSRGFAKQMWLFFLNEKSTFETVLMEPTFLDSCVGDLKKCASSGANHAATFRLAQDRSVVAIGYIARKRFLKCSNGGIRTLRYSFELGRRMLTASGDAKVTALDGSTVAEIFKSGVTRKDLVASVGEKKFSKPMEERAISTCRSGSGRNSRSHTDMLLGTELLIDELHSDILKYADIAEINLNHSSEFPPALEVFTPAGSDKEHLYLAYHGPAKNREKARTGEALWGDTIYLSDSADGEQWSAAQPAWDHWRPSPRHNAATGPALLRLHNRLLVTFGSQARNAFYSQPDFKGPKPANSVYGYFIDGSTHERRWSTVRAQSCKLEKVPEGTDGAMKDFDGSFKKRICDEARIARIGKSYNWDALFTWEMEPGEKTRMFTNTGGVDRIELLDQPLQKFFAPSTRASTSRPPALTRTLHATRGPSATNNAAQLLFVDDQNGIQMVAGDFDRFSCWGCFDSQDWYKYIEIRDIMEPFEAEVSGLDLDHFEKRDRVRDAAMPALVKKKFKDLESSSNRTEEMAVRLAGYQYEAYEQVHLTLQRPPPLAETRHTPGITAHPQWLAIAYLAEPKTGSKKRTLEFFTFSGSEPENLSTIVLPGDAEPVSGPSLIYDHERATMFLTVADTKGALHLLKQQPGDKGWTSLRVIENETKDRPAMAIFEDSIYVALRRESGQIIVAPIYDITEPRIPFMLSDDPRFSYNDQALVDTEARNWVAPRKRQSSSASRPIGFSGWEFGTPTIGPKVARDYSAAWYTQPTRDYPNINGAEASLMTPVIQLPETGQTDNIQLVFEHWLRASPGDSDAGGRVLYSIEFSNGEHDFQPLDLIIPNEVNSVEGTTLLKETNGAWQKVTARLPSDVFGQPIRLKFELNDKGDSTTQNGWIIDSVNLLLP